MRHAHIPYFSQGIALIQVNQRKNRDFQEFETLEDVINILKSQFTNRKLYIKYAVDKTEIIINEYLPDGTMMLVTDPNYKNDGIVIIIYGLSDKYLEIDLEVIEERGPGYYHCKVKTARRAMQRKARSSVQGGPRRRGGDQFQDLAPHHRRFQL